MSQLPLIHAVIPTFNEEEELRICLDSLASQEGVQIQPIVANAGNPLSLDLAARCLEVNIDKSCFWAASTQAGFDKALEIEAKVILLGNADNRFLPGSAAALYAAFTHDPDSVYGSPGYVEEPSGRLRLQFSRDLVIPFFLHNFHRRDWEYLEDAPDGILPTNMAGQGVMFKADYLRRFRIRYDVLPQYRSDHTLWNTMRRGGVKIFLVCRSGIVNERPLSAAVWAKGITLKGIWYYLTSPYPPDSATVMWRYRRANLPLPLAVISFVIMCPATWIYRLLKAGATWIKRLVSGRSVQPSERSGS